VPQERKGAEREKHIMQRAAYNLSLFKAAETVTASNQTALATVSSPEKSTTGRPSERRLSREYIPVYRVQLVRERTVTGEQRRSIRNPDDVVAILRDELLESDREKLISVMLNAKNVVIGMEVVSVGSLTASIVTPRELFKSAILASAAAIIISHNHPSGEPAPSHEDIRLTERISKAGEILGIKLLDHVIIGELGHYSFSDAGRLRGGQP
jgi:DNA repair protein RadC